ncbi:alpha-L-fucosidase [Kribbella aluminosa]|uniref:alpha-L-fucosidase n=1 Tax=Kribbella aluminosa TaxID=416017 RepID=A0ABS4UJG3_9ACTN|nr:alpha-L-fucosidase [Kribbella aluminosa]
MTRKRTDEWFTAARFGLFMHYGLAVLTAKHHHEGFCLWPSPVSDFTIAQAPAAGRDLVAEFADACRAEGLKIGLYYSLIE